MKLLKIIAFLFLVHFVRKFYLAYMALKQVREQALKPTEGSEIIQAEFKVIKD